jgi:small conductance mechanosensitive channel
VRSHLDDIRRQLEERTGEAAETARLENEREYFKRVEGYEQRRLQQAELHKRSAQQKEAIGQLRQRLQEGGKSVEQLRARRSEMTPEERLERAAEYREQANIVNTEAAALEEQVTAEEKEIEPLQQLLPGLEAIERALEERLRTAGSLADAQRLAAHVRRTRVQLDTERQQVDLMVATMENIVYAKLRQATLTRDLANVFGQCAEVLVPSEPSFWERHRKIVDSLAILAAVIAASYAIRVVIWLIRRAITVLNALAGRRVSVKRIGTLLSFAGSILKLFVWIFGLVAILNEFGVDPAKSTGAIGLIGLIMAGMFQQIVVDFVKGLDIVAGRHYNVGDFIEVDGKYGHVMDFNVKHTRIRSVSGQELNIPNSRCVPSRRFPDGYVDNYVDVTLESDGDVNRARHAIDALCEDLNQRIEPVREEPEMVQRFSGPNGRATVRYRLRVLPGCGWVATDHFIPAIKKALAEAGIETVTDPVLFYINRIETFRRLFSRRLSEEEIIRDVAQDKQVPAAT